MGTVHHINEARKARAEAHEVMHYAGPDAFRNAGCPHCRICEICGEPACNRGGPDGPPSTHVWTDDHETWANHTHSCKPVPIIGAPQ